MRRRPTAFGLAGSGLVLLVVALLFFLALHGPVGTPRSTVDTSEGRNPTHDRLAAFDTGTRNGTLAILVQKGGEACPRVDRSIFQGFDPQTGRAFWSVSCQGGHAYPIMILADEHGATRIADCAGLAHAGVPCFQPLY